MVMERNCKLKWAGEKEQHFNKRIQDLNYRTSTTGNDSTFQLIFL